MEVWSLERKVKHIEKDQEWPYLNPVPPPKPKAASFFFPRQHGPQEHAGSPPFLRTNRYTEHREEGFFGKHVMGLPSNRYAWRTRATTSANRLSAGASVPSRPPTLASPMDPLALPLVSSLDCSAPPLDFEILRRRLELGWRFPKAGWQ